MSEAMDWMLLVLPLTREYLSQDYLSSLADCTMAVPNKDGSVEGGFSQCIEKCRPRKIEVMPWKEEEREDGVVKKEK